jgi:hypothetical protein
MKKISKAEQDQNNKDYLARMDGDIGDLFNRGLSFQVCLRCVRINGDEDERRSFVSGCKQDGYFYCPEKARKGVMTVGKVFLASDEPPKWCKFAVEHVVIRK